MAVSRRLSATQFQADGTQTPNQPGRINSYGEQIVATRDAFSSHMYADEGGYFVVTNPTPGTTIAFPVSASSSFTSVFFVLNNNGSAGGKRVFLDYMKILPTVAPASGTSMQLAIQVDTGNRYSSGGTGPTSGVSVNGAYSDASVGRLYYASGGTAITASAATGAVRLVHRSVPRSVIPAVLDEIVVDFGSWASAGSSSATTAGRTSTNAPPIILDGQQSAVFNIWFPSNSITGLSAEFEFGWWER